MTSPYSLQSRSQAIHQWIWMVAKQLTDETPAPFTTEMSSPPQDSKRRQRADSGFNSICSGDIESEVYNEIQICKQVPFRNYVCHRCYKTGHMITDCPTREINPKTPYQGNAVSTGQFKCSCGRKWDSKFVIANRMYICRGCKRMNYPVKMWKKDNLVCNQDKMYSSSKPIAR